MDEEGLVVLTEAKIREIISDPKNRSVLPNLFNKEVRAGSSCNSCASRKMRKAAQAATDLKKRVAELPAAQKASLIELLGARKVRVIYRGDKGKKIIYTFG